jgi:hypothetical protein
VARLEHPGGDEDRGDQQEEPGRDPLHAVEALLLERRVLDLREGDVPHAGKKHRPVPARHPQGEGDSAPSRLLSRLWIEADSS